MAQTEKNPVLTVEVVFATPERQELVSVEVTAGSTVGDAIRKSRLAERFPDHDLGQCKTGIWGEPVTTDRAVREGDRIELYRPLAIDPREARRLLAAEGRSMGRSTADD